MENQAPFVSFDVSAALRRGEQLLQDRDWTKAQSVYDQILMSSPECGEAFVGLMLSENHCASLGELSQFLPTIYREEMEFPDALSEAERVRYPGFDGHYASRLASAVQNRERIEKAFDGEKNYEHALEYGDDELRAALARLRASVLTAYDSRVEAARQDEAAARKKVRDNFDVMLAYLDDDRKSRGWRRLLEQLRSKLSPAARDKAAKTLRVLKLTLICGLATLVLLGAVLGIVKLSENGKSRSSERLSSSGRQNGGEETTLTEPPTAEPTAPPTTEPPLSEEEKAYRAAADQAQLGNKAAAAIAFGKLGEYSDARERSLALWSEIAVRKTLDAGGYHTLGIKADGTVDALGRNDEGQCGVSGWRDIVAVDAGGGHSIGLKADGTVVAVGRSQSGQCSVSEWLDIVSVASGGSHTLGIKPDGTIVAVGWNKYGQCDVEGWRDIVAVTADSWHTVGLKADGTVVAAGLNDRGQCEVSGWRDIVAVAAGSKHTVGLKADGTVVAVGDNDEGQCDVSDWRDIVALAANSWNTVGIKADGTVVAVGRNNEGQCNVFGWRDIVAVVTGGYYTVGLKSDGTVVAVGNNEYGQCDVSGWKNIKVP